MTGSRPGDLRRPPLVAQYAAQVAEWLREDPSPSATEILRRARLAGYRGGKTALYELVRRVRTLPLDELPIVTQQIIVVARDREHLCNFFKRAFEGNPTVQVVIDRRAGERRQRSGSYERERRQRRRRSPERIDGLLRAIGWTIVRIRPPKTRRDSAS